MVTSTGAAAAAIVQAIKASGVIVRLDADQFTLLLTRVREPLVVSARTGLFWSGYRYLTSYKGLAFTTRTKEPLLLPTGAELVEAKRIWVPNR